VSTERDVNRIVRSWMDEGVTALPDRVLDAVLDQVPATPQRQSTWLARRFSIMNNIVRFGLAAAAVILVALVGIYLVGGSNVASPPEATPSPTQTPAPTPAAIPLVPTGALDAGTYLMPMPYGGTAFAFTLLSGWENPPGDGFIRKNRDSTSVLETTTGVNFAAWQIDAVYADACQAAGTDEPVDETVTALATALASQAGRETSGPADTVLDGYPTQVVELIAPDDLSECGGNLRTWPGLNGDEDSGWPAGPGQTDTVYIMDIDGTRLVIVATHWADTAATDLAELEEVVASIQIP
jgi:hypothetical protein